MAELEDRPKIEAHMARVLARLGAKQRKELERKLGNPPDVRKVPDGWWKNKERELEAVALLLLLDVFRQSALQHGMDAALAKEAARTFAGERAEWLAREFTANSRKWLDDADSGWREDIATGRVEPDEKIPVSEIRKATLRILGPKRMATVAITETTTGQHQGSEEAVKSTTGLSDEDLWNTEQDNKVCPVCAPLDKTPRSYWSRFFPKGPPTPHSRCRCWISYVPSVVEAWDPAKHPNDPDGKYTKGGNAASSAVQAWADKRFSNPEHAKAFVEWFGDSKVVDEKGEPLVVYHGTSQSRDEFVTGDREGYKGRPSAGAYFTAQKEQADSYGPHVEAVFLSLSNPLVIHSDSEAGYVRPPTTLTAAAIREYEASGHDGIVYHWKDKELGNMQFNEVVAFHPNQIKSATGNRGTFSRTSNKITEAWDPAKHPNDPDGKYTRGGNPTGGRLPEAATSGLNPAVVKKAEEYLASLGDPPPPPEPGMTRLFRGHAHGTPLHASSYFADVRGLAGVAIPFAKLNGRGLYYVDVPTGAVAQLNVAVTDGEYQIPREYWSSMKPWGKSASATHAPVVPKATVSTSNPWAMIESWDASKHPNDPDGKYTRGGNASSPVQAWAAKRFANPAHAKAFVEWFGDSKVVDEKGEPLVVYHGTAGEFDEFKADTKNAWSDTLGIDTYFHSTTSTTASTYANQFVNGRVMEDYVSLQNPLVIDARGGEWIDAIGEASGNIQTYRTPEELQFLKTKEAFYEKHGYAAEYEPDTIPAAETKALEDASKALTYHIQANQKLYANAKRQPYGHDGIIVHNVMDSTSADPTTEGGSYNPFTTVVIAFHPSQIKSATGNAGTFSRSSNKITEAWDPAKHPNDPDGKYTKGGNQASPAVQAWAEKRFANPEHAKAFVAWFGDSKVVDEKGEPLVVYRGGATDLKPGMIYSTPDKEYAEKFHSARGGELVDAVIHMANPIDATSLGAGDITNDNLFALLKKNGIETDGLENDYRDRYRRGVPPFWQLVKEDRRISKSIQDAGFDGIKQTEKTGSKPADSYIVFHPSQIKSATGNAGTFSKASNNITEAWDPAKHPNDPDGKYTKGGNARDKAGGVDVLSAIHDDALRQRVHDTLTDIDRDYGLDIKTITVGELPAGVFGDHVEAAHVLTLATGGRGGKDERVWTNEHHLTLNAGIWRDRATLKAYLDTMPDGYIADKSAAGVVRHEAAHVLEKQHPNDFQAITRIFHEYKASGALISKYSAENPREMVAEAFSHYLRQGTLDGTGAEKLEPIFKSWKKNK